MDKIKLAICMKDLEYQARFVNCFMNHYKHQYELHVFTNLEELKSANPMEFSVIITGEYTTDELTNFVERGEIILALTESGTGEKKSHLENLYFTEKYQEVYRIAELLPRLAVERDGERLPVQKNKDYKWTGVYSLCREELQLSFTSLLANLYGEEEKVLVLDLQSYSGLTEMEDDIPHMGLEDLMSIAITGTYSKGRILDCIGHEVNWDFVYPVKNNQCLMEGTDELYEILLEILERELGYQRIIINFGDLFPGQFDMMSRCHEFYLLCSKNGVKDHRHETFFRELEACRRGSLLQGMKRVEIPSISGTQETWRSITEKWYWNSFGHRIRKFLDKEADHGPAM